MNKTGRILLVVFVLALSGLLLYPTVRWYFFTTNEERTLSLSSNVQIRDYARKRAQEEANSLINILKEDKDTKIPSSYSYLKKDAKYYAEKNGKSIKSWSVYTLLNSFPDQASFVEAIETKVRKEILSVKKLKNFVLQLGLDLRGGMSVLLEADLEEYESKNGEKPSQSQLTALLSEDVEILTSRIDQFGVSEPDIRLQGSDQILIELPGEADPERVNSFLRSRGSLVFSLVDKTLTDRVNADYRRFPSLIFSENGQIVQPVYIPENRVLLGYYTEDAYGIETLESLVVLEKEVGLDGKHLKSAEVSTDSQTKRPVVNFRLDSEGGDIFYKLTSSNVGQSLAVVMDGKVKSVARINSAIHDSVQLSGGFTEEEANSLAVTLKTSSLPVELVVLSQQAIGATLGDDSVKVSIWAISVGLLLVIIFMLIYYGPSGLVADFALLMNLIMMLALLSSLSFTLTLSSIAGIVLTLGMAIDANVIIYERMKEEVRAGMVGYMAVKSGFKNVFWTIMDSNVTTIIAAIVLSVFGSSSVKGFANTLAIGVACSIFTSLFVSHIIFDLVVTEEKLNPILLSWRKK